MNDLLADDRINGARAGDPAQQPAKRGRKSETPAQRLERLLRQVQDAKHAAREADQRKNAVVGEALLLESAEDPALKMRVIEILRRRVTTAQAKADIASLLVGQGPHFT